MELQSTDWRLIPYEVFCWIEKLYQPLGDTEFASGHAGFAGAQRREHDSVNTNGRKIEDNQQYPGGAHHTLDYKVLEKQVAHAVATKDFIMKVSTAM